MELIQIATTVVISALGATVMLLIALGKWIVNQISKLDTRLSIVETKQENDRTAKKEILDTIKDINTWMRRKS